MARAEFKSAKGYADRMRRQKAHNDYGRGDRGGDHGHGGGRGRDDDVRGHGAS